MRKGMVGDYQFSTVFGSESVSKEFLRYLKSGLGRELFDG